MTYVQEFFNGEAVLTPDDAWLIAVKADCFGYGPAPASATLLPVELLCQSEFHDRFSALQTF